MDEEPGVYSGSGYVRVDRRKALEILRNYQLPDSAMFAALWVRAAVASRATAIRIRTSSFLDGLLDRRHHYVEVRFDGLPFSPAELEDPFNCLFDDGIGGPRNRDLALGILTILRLGEVVVWSGAGKDRKRLQIKALGEDSLEDAAGSTYETVLRAVFRKGVIGFGLTHVRPEQFLLSPAPVWINGVQAKNLPSLGEEAQGLAFKAGKVRGWIGIPAHLHPWESPLRVFQRGVLACELYERLPSGIKVAAYIDSEEIALDASLSSAVKDERYQGMLKIVDAEARRLVLRACREQSRRFGEMSNLLGDASLRGLWKRRFLWGPGAVKPTWTDWAFSWLELIKQGPFTQARERARAVERSAAAVAWLRETVARCSWALGREDRKALLRSRDENLAHLARADGKPLGLCCSVENREKYEERFYKDCPGVLDILRLMEQDVTALRRRFRGRGKEGE